ncbi:acyl-CoA-binding domain-containing protein 5 [Acyrthosiphon pisum]|uniref:ACB domain-containing protein n=1 Tax=Acyrthosiphon pisum TaxID=7029 RepID=A0A8R2D2U8_ACYPI|nr:acyl-CoA-binding domain-containing protein 5 [Acyrthosiphon pisum]|eukprot:XP_016658283.1 PREDICTED: acyl-CoA-binding domain-containing protein 5 [Acyrthosiphon pisum]
MSTQEKFTAAINVIRSLPKNGAYQPSKDLLLRFYAYFKQATIGPNNQPKPSFWDVVNRAKWQAWYSLGDMSKEKAMQEYVDELKKIVETMAYTNPVADFVSSLDSFYESVSIDDLEMVVGPIERGNLIEKNSSSLISINEHQDIADTEIDEECFHDVLEVNNLASGERLINVQTVNQYLSSSDYIEDFVSDNCIPISQQNGNSMIQLQCANDFLDEFKLQIRNTVSTMKYDLDIITNRVVKIELKLDEIKKTRERKHYQALYFNLFQIVVLLGWPIIVQLIFNWFKRQNRRKALNVKTL